MGFNKWQSSKATKRLAGNNDAQTGTLPLNMYISSDLSAEGIDFETGKDKFVPSENNREEATNANTEGDQQGIQQGGSKEVEDEWKQLYEYDTDSDT